MGYFETSDQVYEHLGALMSDVLDDEGLGPRFRTAGTVLRQELRDPESAITVVLAGTDSRVEVGETDTVPEVTLRMAADTAHRFWLGEVSVGIALARGEITAEGPLRKILELVPLTRPVFPIYRRRLAAQGREDLVAV